MRYPSGIVLRPKIFPYLVSVLYFTNNSGHSRLCNDLTNNSRRHIVGFQSSLISLLLVWLLLTMSSCNPTAFKDHWSIHKTDKFPYQLSCDFVYVQMTSLNSLGGSRCTCCRSSCWSGCSCRCGSRGFKDRQASQEPSQHYLQSTWSAEGCDLICRKNDFTYLADKV